MYSFRSCVPQHPARTQHYSGWAFQFVLYIQTFPSHLGCWRLKIGAFRGAGTQHYTSACRVCTDCYVWPNNSGAENESFKQCPGEEEKNWRQLWGIGNGQSSVAPCRGQRVVPPQSSRLTRLGLRRVKSLPLPRLFFIQLRISFVSIFYRFQKNSTNRKCLYYLQDTIVAIV